MANIYNYKSFDLGFKDIDSKQGIVTGYFASFNTKDLEGDIILPTAFNRSISHNMSRIKHLLDHDIKNVVGKLNVLQPDSIGLYYESKAGSHTKGQDFLKMAESGIITEHSFGWMPVKGGLNTKDGARYISDLIMFEGSSLQAWGMNQNTPLTGVKAMYKDPEALQKRIKSLDAFCRSTDASDETIELLLIEVKQLTQIIITIQESEDEEDMSDETTQLEEDSPVSEKGANMALVAAYLSL